jgi:hypothetical protein
MLTVKLDPKLRAQIKALAAAIGVTTSELVRTALRERVAAGAAKRRGTAYEETRDLCGVAQTMDPNLSARSVTHHLAGSRTH